MVVSLPLSLAEFTLGKQDNFRAGVASAAGVSLSDVEISAMREHVSAGSRREHEQVVSAGSRRLLAASVEVRPSCQRESFQVALYLPS